MMKKFNKILDFKNLLMIIKGEVDG